MVSTSLNIWLSAILTIMAFTFIYKENPLYRFTENLLVAVSAAYTCVLGLQKVWTSAIIPLYKGEHLSVIIPLVIGCLLYVRFYKGFEWVNRWPLAVVVGVGTAVALRRILTVEILGQVMGTIKSVNSIDNIVLIITVVTSIFYFFFTVEHEGPVGWTAKIGRYAIMVFLGAKYASSVSLRFVLLTGRLKFLLWDWLGISP